MGLLTGGCGRLGTVRDAPDNRAYVWGNCARVSSSVSRLTVVWQYARVSSSVSRLTAVWLYVRVSSSVRQIFVAAGFLFPVCTLLVAGSFVSGTLSHTQSHSGAHLTHTLSRTLTHTLSRTLTHTLSRTLSRTLSYTLR